MRRWPARSPISLGSCTSSSRIRRKLWSTSRAHWVGATIRTAADVVNDDINFSNGRFTVQSSGKTILGRLSTNSDPRSATPDADADVIRAVIKTGVMGLQAGIAVAKKVLTLDTIGTLATVGMANPPLLHWASWQRKSGTRQ